MKIAIYNGDESQTKIPPVVELKNINNDYFPIIFQALVSFSGKFYDKYERNIRTNACINYRKVKPSYKTIRVCFDGYDKNRETIDQLEKFIKYLNTLNPKNVSQEWVCENMAKIIE